jgi:hypothetical protein
MVAKIKGSFSVYVPDFAKTLGKFLDTASAMTSSIKVWQSTASNDHIGPSSGLFPDPSPSGDALYGIPRKRVEILAVSAGTSYCLEA